MKKQLDKCLSVLCGQGLDQGVFSAVSAVLSVYRGGEWLRFGQSAGRTQYGPISAPVRKETLFDLASLTKPLSTTLSLLALVASGRLDWQDSLVRFFPSLEGTEQAEIRLWHLLNHCSGLPAYYPYFKQRPPLCSKENKQFLRQHILTGKRLHQPGETCLYSDLGFFLLGEIIERQSGQSLDRWYQETITDPFGLTQDIHFLPLQHSHTGALENMAATEDCPWRGRIIQGEVHDEHCWLVGGVAGHAGLFGTRDGVSSLCELILDCWQGRNVQSSIPASLLRQLLEYHHPGSTWALGFDRPTPGVSSSGRSLSPRSVGHLGYTGTSFWIDPDQDLVIVLLTNRVHPSRANERIRQFRPYFHDALMGVLRSYQAGK